EEQDAPGVPVSRRPVPGDPGAARGRGDLPALAPELARPWPPATPALRGSEDFELGGRGQRRGRVVDFQRSGSTWSTSSWPAFHPRRVPEARELQRNRQGGRVS